MGAEVSATPAGGGPEHPAVLRRCVPSGLGRGVALFVLAAGGQRFYVGVGNGRKRQNILGAYSPDDHDYVDLRLTKENITGEQFVKLLEALRAKHPDTEKFILYLDNARYYSKPCVKEWLAKHREFRLVPLPAYSPNLNLIERLWKLLRKKALNRWHKTFEEMQAAVAEVLDRLGDYRDELSTLMTERFAIVEVEPAVA